MTIPDDPTPYESDIRANTSTGLGGLFSQLAAIAAGIGSLPALLSAVQQIRDDLAYLTGPLAERPSLWRGLADLLGTSPNDARLNLLSELNTTRINVEDLSFNMADMINRVNLIQNQLTAIRGAPAASIRDVITSTSGIQAQLNALSNDLGTISETPAGLPIKGVLNAIRLAAERSADCCEGTTEPDPGEPTEPPGPEFACGNEGTPLRATGYQFWRNLPADAQDEYIVLFPGVTVASDAALVWDQSLDTIPLPAMFSDGTDVEVCMEWNLLDGQVPSQVVRYITDTAGEFEGQVGALQGVTIGGGSTDVYNLLDGQRFLTFVVRVAEGAGEPAHLNYWLRFTPEPV